MCVLAEFGTGLKGLKFLIDLVKPDGADIVHFFNHGALAVKLHWEDSTAQRAAWLLSMKVSDTLSGFKHSHVTALINSTHCH
jgi:hypothetical protein